MFRYPLVAYLLIEILKLSDLLDEGNDVKFILHYVSSFGEKTLLTIKSTATLATAEIQNAFW